MTKVVSIVLWTPGINRIHIYWASTRLHGSYRSHLQFPGGKVEERDGQPVVAAVRELYEETKLKRELNQLNFLGQTRAVHPTKGPYTIDLFSTILTAEEHAERTEPEEQGPWCAYTSGMMAREIAIPGTMTGIYLLERRLSYEQ